MNEVSTIFYCSSATPPSIMMTSTDKWQAYVQALPRWRDCLNWKCFQPTVTLVVALNFANGLRFKSQLYESLHLWKPIITTPRLWVCSLSVLSFSYFFTWWSIFITTVNIATRWYWWDCLWQGCRSDFPFIQLLILNLAWRNRHSLIFLKY